MRHIVYGQNGYLHIEETVCRESPAHSFEAEVNVRVAGNFHAQCSSTHGDLCGHFAPELMWFLNTST